MTDQHPLRLLKDIKNAVYRYDSLFNAIQSPHSVYEQKTTAIRTRITQIWSSLATTPADQIQKLQEDVIELGGQLKELEIDHKTNIKKYERDYNQKLQETADAFRAHVTDIIGPANVQSHTPAVSTAVSNDQPLENDSNDLAILSPLPDLSQHNQRILPSPASPLGDSITVGTSSVRRLREPALETALATRKKRKAGFSNPSRNKRRRGDQEDEGERGGEEDENMDHHVSVSPSKSTRRHTRHNPRRSNEVDEEEFEGITNPEAGTIYLAFWEMSQEWFAVLVLPMHDLETVGVPGSIESLGLAEPLPPCYRYNRTNGTYSWARRYQDGQPMVKDRIFPVMYFDGRDFPARSAVGWISAKDLRKFDPRARNGHIPHVRSVRKYLRAHPPRASTAPEQEQHERRRRDEEDDEDGEYRQEEEEEEEEEGEEEDDDYEEEMEEEETNEMESETMRAVEGQSKRPGQSAARPPNGGPQTQNTESPESGQNQTEPEPQASNQNQESPRPPARPQPSSPLFRHNTFSPHPPPSSPPTSSAHRHPSPPRPASTSKRPEKLPGPIDYETETKPLIRLDVISIPDSDDEDEANANQAPTSSQQPGLHGFPMTSDQFIQEQSPNPALRGQNQRNGESSTNAHAYNQAGPSEASRVTAFSIAQAALAIHGSGQHDSGVAPSYLMGDRAHQPPNEGTFQSQNPQHWNLNHPYEDSATHTGQGHLSSMEAEYYAGSRRRMEAPDSTREPAPKMEPQPRQPFENHPSAPASIGNSPNLASLPSITSMIRTSPAPQAPLRPSSSGHARPPAQVQSPGQVQQFSGQIRSPVQSSSQAQLFCPVQYSAQVHSPGQVYSGQIRPQGQAQGFVQGQHSSQVHNNPAITHPPHPPHGSVSGSNYAPQEVSNAHTHAPGTSYGFQVNTQPPCTQRTSVSNQAQTYPNASQPNLQRHIQPFFHPVNSPFSSQNQSTATNSQPAATNSQTIATHSQPIVIHNRPAATAPQIVSSQSTSSQPTPPPNSDLLNTPEGFWPRALDPELVDYLKQYQEQANLQKGLLGLRVRSGHYVCPFCPNDKRKLYAQSGGVVSHLKRHWGAFKSAEVAQAAQAVQVVEAARQGQA